MAVNKLRRRVWNPDTQEYDVNHYETEVEQVEGLKAKYRQPDTAYAVGAVVYATALSANQKLVCVKAGTSASGLLTINSTAEGVLITDGGAVWQVDSLADGNYTAMHQNGIAGGRDLTAYWDSGYMSANIQAGKFVGMHIGDFIIKTVSTAANTYTNKSGTSVTQAAATYSNVKWLLGGFDVHLHCGDTETTAHHVLIIPAGTLRRNVNMNPTADATGAYLGSDMWRVHMPIWAAAIKNAFGAAHILSHRESLANAINATVQGTAGGFVGKSSNLAWATVEANIPNEAMVYGNSAFGSSFDEGDFSRQLPLYALECGHLDDRSWFWLRSVASSGRFAIVYATGFAHCFDASAFGGDGGIRPYSLLR